MDGNQPAPVAPLEPGTETVLVVEDYAGLRDLAELMLQKAGYSVVLASSGDEALKWLERHAGQVDLLLTDVVMPGLSGRELVEQMEKVYPEIKVIYTSGYTDDMVVRQGVDANTANFLAKPYTYESLTTAVRAALDTGD